MENSKKIRKFWSLVQIIHAIVWASVLILYSWIMFAPDGHHIFNILIVIAGLQVSVLAAAKERLLLNHNR